jgi:hypothetical protein
MATHEDLSRTHAVKGSGNRGFGGVFIVFFLVVGFWPFVAGHPPRRWALMVAGALLVVTVAAPALLGPLNRLWLCLGNLLNRIMSRVVLAFLFYGVVTPLGILARWAGKDPLRRAREPAAGSYWIVRKPPGPSPDSLPHQF